MDFSPPIGRILISALIPVLIPAGEPSAAGLPGLPGLPDAQEARAPAGSDDGPRVGYSERRALLVAVGEPGSSAVAGTRALHDRLIAGFEFAPEAVELLVGAEATKAGILATLSRWSERAEPAPDDEGDGEDAEGPEKELVALWFAGPAHEEEGRRYLVPWDATRTTDGDGESRLDASSLLELRELAAAVEAVRAHHVVTFLDAALDLSGRAWEPPPRHDLERGAHEFLCAGAAPPADLDAPSPFAAAVLAGLGDDLSADFDENDAVSVGELFESVRRAFDDSEHEPVAGFLAGHRGGSAVLYAGRPPLDPRYVRTRQIAKQRRLRAEEVILQGKAGERWKTAVASIADLDESPWYGGLRFPLVDFLVPLGRDPSSGFWEFAHTKTGEEPLRDVTTGELVLTESTAMVLVLLPGGPFWMGAQRDDPSALNYDPRADTDEGPVHRVELSPFLLSKYEMTQAQWKRATGRNPSFYSPGWHFGGHDVTLRHPIENVGYGQCVGTLRRLGLRLPSEAEWEYAARGGTSSVWATGNNKRGLADAANLADSFAKSHGGPPDWKYEPSLDDGYVMHAPVGSFRPNAFGLHDIHGNLWEWVLDAYDTRAYGRGIDLDPVYDASSSLARLERVRRGGGFNGGSAGARVSNRHARDPQGTGRALGCRPALSLPR